MFSHIKPIVNATAINLASDTDLSTAVTRGLWVGGAGDVKVTMAGELPKTDGATTTFTGVPAGTLLPIKVKTVFSSANGTSATSILALY